MDRRRSATRTEGRGILTDSTGLAEPRAKRLVARGMAGILPIPMAAVSAVRFRAVTERLGCVSTRLAAIRPRVGGSRRAEIVQRGIFGSGGWGQGSQTRPTTSLHRRPMAELPTNVAAGLPSPEVDRIDERLLVASRSGDREAFRQLMERHRADLLRFLVRFLGSRSAADDVFQDTFLQVHLAAQSFDAERRFRPWLFAIAANKARDFHRRQRRRATASLSSPIGDGDSSLVDLLAGDTESPASPTEAREIQFAVKKVVDELPVHYREILLLSYFQRMSYQQIAECLGIPLGTVKSRLHAAVAHFAGAWKATRSEKDDEND